MSLEFAVQKKVSRFIEILGKGLRYTGIGVFWVMVMAGPFALDIVILAAQNKQREQDGCHHHHDYFYFSAWLFPFRSNLFDHLPTLFIGSLLMTATAVVFSFFLGVPAVGAAFILGWASVAGLFGLGEGLIRFSAWVKPNERDYTRPSRLQRGLEWLRQCFSRAPESAAESVVNPDRRHETFFSSQAEGSATAPVIVERGRGFFQATESSTQWGDVATRDAQADVAAFQVGKPYIPGYPGL